MDWDKYVVLRVNELKTCIGELFRRKNDGSGEEAWISFLASLGATKRVSSFSATLHTLKDLLFVNASSSKLIFLIFRLAERDCIGNFESSGE